MYLLPYYISYAAISLVLIAWLARTLSNNGRVLLLEALQGDVELAGSIHRMLLVGFYLISIGYLAAMLTTNRVLNTLHDLVELESAKLGVFLMILGILHLFNVLILTIMRQKSTAARASAL